MDQSTRLPDRLAGSPGLLLAGPPNSFTGDKPQGYTRAMQAMHWGNVTQLLGAYLAARMIDHAASHAQAAYLIMLHRSFGVMILLLTGLRLAVRRRTPVPPPPAGMPAVQRLAARASVIISYMLLIVLPLLGFIGSILHGDRMIFFGNIALPALLPADRALAHQIFKIHGWTALVLLALIGLHVAAALYHHFVRKDGVLASMLPGMRGSQWQAGRQTGEVRYAGRGQS
jgi:cytochrome b561